MAEEVIMPKFGFTQEEAEIVEWLVQEGDYVEQGDPICEVTTDKVNMEVEAPKTGYLRGIKYQEGDIVPVTVLIAWILDENEEIPAEEAEPAATTATTPEPEQQPTDGEPAAAAPGGPVSATPVALRIAAAEQVDLSQVRGTGPGSKITRQDVEAAIAARQHAGTNGGGRVRATPAARRVAREQGLDLHTVRGSGPRGRVQEADVIAAAEALAAEAAPVSQTATEQTTTAEGVEVMPLKGMRKRIAERMQASYQQAPHIMFTLDIDMTGAIEFRRLANDNRPEGTPKVSMTAVIIKAVAWALRQMPMVNSHFDGEQILLQPDVNVGVAVALDDGLIVPVVHNADQKGVIEIGEVVTHLAARARDSRLKPDDVNGGTFTVSNLGMFGIDHFTAIINPPQVAILAVGRIATRFVPDENNQPVARPMMTVTLSADHRVVDGAIAARFVSLVRDALTNPARILL